MHNKILRDDWVIFYKNIQHIQTDLMYFTKHYLKYCTYWSSKIIEKLVTRDILNKLGKKPDRLQIYIQIANWKLTFLLTIHPCNYQYINPLFGVPVEKYQRKQH